MPTTTLPYRYAHASTESMTGYFSCEPPEDLSFEDALARLEAAPLDEFLHRHLLRTSRPCPRAKPPHCARLPVRCSWHCSTKRHS